VKFQTFLCQIRCCTCSCIQFPSPVGAAQQDQPFCSRRRLFVFVRLIASSRLLSVRLRASSKPPRSGSGSGSGPASALFGRRCVCGLRCVCARRCVCASPPEASPPEATASGGLGLGLGLRWLHSGSGSGSGSGLGVRSGTGLSSSVLGLGRKAASANFARSTTGVRPSSSGGSRSSSNS